MDRDGGTHLEKQLQLWEVNPQRLERDRRLVRATEARHRARAIGGDGTRLEDLATEWIELLRDSSRKAAG